MHMIFTETELKWINMKAFGWKIKDNCPLEIRISIENKLKDVNNKNYTEKRV